MDNKIFNINDVSASDNFTYTYFLKGINGVDNFFGTSHDEEEVNDLYQSWLKEYFLKEQTLKQEYAAFLEELGLNKSNILEYESNRLNEVGSVLASNGYSVTSLPKNNTTRNIEVPNLVVTPGEIVKGLNTPYEIKYNHPEDNPKKLDYTNNGLSVMITQLDGALGFGNIACINMATVFKECYFGFFSYNDSDSYSFMNRHFDLNTKYILELASSGLLSFIDEDKITENGYYRVIKTTCDKYFK